MVTTASPLAVGERPKSTATTPPGGLPTEPEDMGQEPKRDQPYQAKAAHSTPPSLPFARPVPPPGLTDFPRGGERRT